MNRRAFLSLLATGLVGATVDVDRVLWVPGAKKIFLPPPAIALSDAQLGVALRLIKDYDVGPFPPTRFDVLYGWRSLQSDRSFVINA